MGIPERKQREREELKTKILEAAKTLFVEKGFEATSMRNIAEMLEFSPTRLYIYYKDKNAIVYALHKEGFKIFSEQLRVLQAVDHPFERLKAIGKIYLAFAAQHPDFYELMFVLKGPIEYVKQSSKNENWEEGSKVFQSLADAVAACQQLQFCPGAEPHRLALLIWSTLHGIAMLNLHQHISCIAAEHELSASAKTTPNDLFEIFLSFLESKR